MEVSPAVRGPLISAWSVVSPFGMDVSAFGNGLRSGTAAATALDPEEWKVPFENACLVKGFSNREVLGRKGTRSMDRVTGLAVAAVGRLLQDADGERISGVGQDAALVLGTSTGSAQSIMDFTRDSLTQEKPFFVDPMRFPNTVMNCAAGQSAIWHQLKGPNTTIAGGRASGLLALNYALRLKKSGHARTVLFGAVEEFSSARAWLEWHTRGQDESDAVLGEGAAVLLLESGEVAEEHGRDGLAEVLGLECGVYHEAGTEATVLADCVRRVLERTGVRPDDVRYLSHSQAAGARGAAEQDALADVLGNHQPEPVRCADLIGDTHAAAAAFQIAAVLVAAEGREDAKGQIALITSVDRDGVVGCAVLRLC
ncbi:beta-ketoacyl synthase N-terminal-like domain-containing protein [Streptomyces sp. CA-278952]|uniref:beta-ketoacyl synthase N-terminal-like domain-containing protein n=1 Tax=unclassified Streptomyces TaxID=2593676 RepID=UPI0023688E76|nr:beta-ketoacyl synthase N-terminal-like domain-containing protein [Streptomyces sp. CA-278952]WDG27629.1 beta-ketoacyl synthase N-terminal-like domain-containing protein [Streptomyces sp. CA-278952]